MPFLANAELLLFCRGVGTPRRTWKLHYRLGENTHRIETGFEPDVTECSPAAWRDDDGWHLSFIAGRVGGDDGLPYRLYEMTGPSLDSLSPPRPIAATMVGCLYDRLLAIHRYVVNQSRLRITGPTHVEIRSERRIMRVTCRADRPATLLMTCWSNDHPITYAYDIPSETWARIRTADGRDVYKCSLYGDRMIHAVQAGDDFEDRVLESCSWRSEPLPVPPMQIRSLSAKGHVISTEVPSVHRQAEFQEEADVLARRECCGRCPLYVPSSAPLRVPWGACRLVPCRGRYITALRSGILPRGCPQAGPDTFEPDCPEDD
jgi:hypothetical protein